jgi:hypothetical protein
MTHNSAVSQCLRFSTPPTFIYGFLASVSLAAVAVCGGERQGRVEKGVVVDAHLPGA